MPQLNSTHILLVCIWTWMTLYVIMQKTKMMSMIKTPTKLQHKKTKKPTTPMPWT